MTDANGTAKPPEWHTHVNPCYDAILGPACASEEDTLKNSTSLERFEFICDPREVHRRLYAQLAPSTHGEYAGTYRGTPNTTLFGRDVKANRVTDDKSMRFLSSSEVASNMTFVHQTAKNLFESVKSAKKNEFLNSAVKVFYSFGIVHPFLDGNGHVQRLIFAACFFERPDLELLPTWTIHPRPYDEEIAQAFEQPELGARIESLCSVLSVYVK